MLFLLAAREKADGWGKKKHTIEGKSKSSKSKIVDVELYKLVVLITTKAGKKGGNRDREGEKMVPKQKDPITESCVLPVAPLRCVVAWWASMLFLRGRSRHPDPTTEHLGGVGQERIS